MVIVNTNIFIAAMRGHAIAQTLIAKYAPGVFISAVTEMELLVGATNSSKQSAVEAVLLSHEVIHISKAISEATLQLIKAHNTSTRSLAIPDALIAATCLQTGYPLVTFNTQDFKFIKGLQLAA